jgi:hypothetical protein
MHPHASRLRGPNGMHLAHPDIAFALFPLAPPVALFSLGSPECAQRVPEPCTRGPRASVVRTASTVCTKKPRPRSSPMCPTPLMDVDDGTDRWRCYLAPRAPRERHSLGPWSVAGEAASRLQRTPLAHRATDTRLWSRSRSACERAANPKDSLPCGWPLEPYVSFDADRAVGRPQRFARPSSWGPTLLVCSFFLVSLGNMWVRIRLSSQG